MHLHAQWTCTSELFTAGGKQGQPVPDCPRYDNRCNGGGSGAAPHAHSCNKGSHHSAASWALLATAGAAVHEPCWNGPFCVDAADGDWLQVPVAPLLGVVGRSSIVCSSQNH